MSQHQLTPVFTGLRIGLHALTAVLWALVMLRIIVRPPSACAVVVVLAVIFAVVYLMGSQVSRLRRPWVTYGWLAALTVCWLGLSVMVPEAAYLVFPIFFLYLHLLPGVAGPLSVVAATVATVLGIGWRSGFSVGGVIGPGVAAGVALLIGLGYQTLQREAADRERLLIDLVAAQEKLTASEREQGMLAERARLAREIHDTVAQDLSSIGMLLHAAERADPDHSGAQYIRAARETAGTALAETRSIVRELSPPALDDGLSGALHRIAGSIVGVAVTVDTPATVDLSMDLQTTVLRIVQGAIANVAQHAHADHAHIHLALGEQELVLEVSDDGRGFDSVDGKTGSSDSFGLRAIRERVEQWGGSLSVTSVLGGGTTVTARLPRSAA